MKNVEQWAIKIFTYHLVVLRPGRLNKASIGLSVQLSGMITIVFPMLLALVALVGFLLPTDLGWESIQVPSIVAVLVIVFGTSAITDKIYDRNIDLIQELADKIKRNPEQGAWWAGRQLLKVYLGEIATVVVIVILAKTFI